MLIDLFEEFRIINEHLFVQLTVTGGHGPILETAVTHVEVGIKIEPGLVQTRRRKMEG